jgi:large subunit ribosomal protein L15
MIIKSKVTTKKKKIIGRGIGSGKGGHTSTRGMKGQKSRAGSHISKYFEGGQNPLIRRVPYLRGFKRIKEPIDIISLSAIDKYFAKEDEINLENLLKRGLVKTKKVKILSDGEITKEFKIKKEDFIFSQKSLDKIEKSKAKFI